MVLMDGSRNLAQEVWYQRMLQERLRPALVRVPYVLRNRNLMEEPWLR